MGTNVDAKVDGWMGGHGKGFHRKEKGGEEGQGG